MKYLFILIASLCCLQINAQDFNNGCEIVPNQESVSRSSCVSSGSCNPGDEEVFNFIPTVNAKTKVVKLRFIIFHYSASDPRNFQKSNHSHVQLFKDMVNDVNHRYANLEQTSNQNCYYESKSHPYYR